MWEKGTNRFDIWHWFDENCPNNLHDDLMFNK
jgi:phage terminase large subunit-like protein